MVAALELVGKIYGRLTVLERIPSESGKTVWLCVCECGERTKVRTERLVSGRTKSCGCYRKECMAEVSRKYSTVHGHNTVEYKSGVWNSWHAMKQRCLDPNHSSYDSYGGAGIEVCKEWLDFINFYRDMGDRPEGHTIDRIDGTKGYYKGNCRWATPSQQQRNRHDTRLDEQKAAAIRKDQRKQYVIANEYGLSPSVVSKIKGGKIWSA